MPEYTPAPAVHKVARSIIGEHYPELKAVRVDAVFRDKAAKAKGNLVLGKANRIGGLNAFLARDGAGDGPFFVLEVAVDTWELLSGEQREALVDHLLAYCHLDEDTGALGLRGPDCEEFSHVVGRRGLWRDSLARFAEAAAGQPTLFDALAGYAKVVEGPWEDGDETGEITDD